MSRCARATGKGVVGGPQAPCPALPDKGDILNLCDSKILQTHSLGYLPYYKAICALRLIIPTWLFTETSMLPDMEQGLPVT